MNYLDFPNSQMWKEVTVTKEAYNVISHENNSHKFVVAFAVRTP